ncbi:MAG: hypothetical protein AAFO87_12350, partial [Cyanobacteria bacterium J06607_6]
MTPASDPDLRLSEFLGQNLDAFRELVTFAEVAEGFTLAIVERRLNFAPKTRSGADRGHSPESS